MANRRITLTKEGTARLDRIMMELGLQDKRPEAMRIALAKGLIEATKVPELPEGSSGFTFGDGTIAKDMDYVMLKHLIIEKVAHPIEDKDIDKYILRFAEYGLKVMENEMDSLSSLDNYLLYLTEKAVK